VVCVCGGGAFVDVSFGHFGGCYPFGPAYGSAAEKQGVQSRDGLAECEDVNHSDRHVLVPEIMIWSQLGDDL